VRISIGYSDNNSGNYGSGGVNNTPILRLSAS